MVLAERNTTDVVRNGRRSRGPSPNTHTSGGGVGSQANSAGSGSGSGNSTNASNNEKASSTTLPGAGTPESSDDDNSTKRNGKSKAKQSEYEEKIRVGRDYQAVCPPLVPEVERRPEQMNERALLVWSPTKEIPDMKLEEYISVAKEKYGYNGEQALGMLFWHKHDLERAVLDLANFTPFPDEWTIEDKVLFEQAFQFHGKSFHRIRQMLPDKSIASLVKYYYSWKKTRHRSSAMDRQEKTIKVAVKDGSENGSEVGSNEESDNDDKIQKNRQLMEQLDKECDSINVEDSTASKAAANTEAAATTAQPRITARWTNDEIQVARLALRDYGKNYPMIAKVVTTKTEAHVRSFYVNNRRRYNLDQIVKEYEAAKSEESGAEDQNEAATEGGTTAEAASADTAAAAKPEEGSNNGHGLSQPELQNKKDDPKKKPELATASAALKSGGGDSGTAASSNKSSTAATITIVDESDTATNSSSDVATNSTSNNAAPTGTSSSSLSSASTAPAKFSASNHSERDSEESSSLKSSSVSLGSGKRESTTLSTAEQPPAKKIALATNNPSVSVIADFAGK